LSRPDLNLLFTLDVLLAEGSVARAARRLHLSPSAMSRALARLREATGDPLLVRAGRGLVASPRALKLRDSISQLVHDAEAALRPAGKLDLGQLDRTFTLRASEGFVENFGASLLSRISGEAPGVRLHFLHKLDKDSGPLRDGSVDLETGVVDKTIGPEVRAQALFRDRYMGVVRFGHPLSEGEITPARFAAARAPSTTPWRAWGCNERSLRPWAAFQLRSRWFVPQTWSPASTNGTPAFCMPVCTASRCQCPLRRSRFPCSGTRVWMAIQHIAGFEGAFGAFALSRFRLSSAREPTQAAVF
jgi:DNA-binding transcriptional LysR family regulator